MKNFLSIPKNNNITNIAIGKFDGIHLGHQQILDSLRENSAIIIIDNHTKDFLTSINDRFLRLKNTYPNLYLLELESIKHLEGSAFIAMLLELLPKLETIVVGYDFRFGHNRGFSGNDIANFFKGRVIIIPQVKYNEIPLHSSTIKDLIRHGDIAISNAMLGWNYTIKGEAIKGQGLASQKLFATLNIQTSGYVLPSSGVYASLTDDEMSVSFIGNRLSTDKQFAIETHIIGKAHIPHKHSIRITFLKKIRDNRHFSDLQTLKAQIRQDIAQAKEILDSIFHVI